MISEYIFKENFIEAVLKNGTKFLFDIDDYELISRYTWYLTSHNYISCHPSSGETYLHRMVVGAKPGEYVDHINRNKLDNRKENLRIVANKDNVRNATISKNNVSGITGVYWDKVRNKWHSQIMVDRRAIFLGRYENREDAIRARLLGELQYFGQFSPQRNLFEEYNII